MTTHEPVSQAWSPARETKARCNGGCLREELSSGEVIYVVRAEDFGYKPCPLCISSPGLEPSPERAR